MQGIFLGLGTNLGERNLNLNKALERINKQIGLVLKQSSIHETKAWGKTNQPDFLNMAIEIETRLSPQELLVQCLSIENQLGRVRNEKWGERIIDIDILYYNDIIIDDDDLQIPHPLIQERDFVLLPLQEIVQL